MTAVNTFTIYAQQNPANLDSLNNTYYNYGTTPNTPVAEQNQTYFAYFDGVGGTGPEIIDQTAYSIKYLIDTEGNVVNPEPDTIANRPQAIGLYNLLNNFEIGTNAVVKLIESDPTLTENPNDDALVGKYPVTHIGRLVLLATSEYSTVNTDFLTTMSFQEYGTYIQGGDPPNFSFNARRATTDLSLDLTTIPVTLDWTDIQSNDLEYYDETNTYTFGDSTSNYGLAMSFEVGMGFDWKTNQTFFNERINTLSWFVEYSEDGGSTWSKLPIFIYGDIYTVDLSPSSATSLFDYFNTGTIDEAGTTYSITWTAYLNNDSPNYYNTIRTVPRSFLTGTKVRVRYTHTFSGEIGSIQLTLFGSPDTGNNTRFSLINSTGYSSKVTASYFDNISAPTTAPPFLPQSLTASLNFSAYINDDYVQILPSSSIEFDYQQPSYPLNIQPGDFIRCEYNPNQVATIVEVTAVNESPSRTCLKIFPPVIPSGSTLNHFTIYRVINDGSNIILNVPKPVRGNSFSGVIQPEFVTKELVNKYDKIIVDLTEREIIQ
jgi:hypothetical protein